MFSQMIADVAAGDPFGISTMFQGMITNVQTEFTTVVNQVGPAAMIIVGTVLAIGIGLGLVKKFVHK